MTPDDMPADHHVIFVFDMDGCVMDSYRFLMSFMPKVFADFHVNPDEETIAQVREGIIQMLSGKSSKRLLAKLMLHAAKAFGLGPIQRLRFILYLNKLYRDNAVKITFVDGALDTFRTLRDAGHKIAIFTSASRKDFGRLVDGKPEFGTLIDTIVTRDDVERMKPDPEGVLLVKERLGTDLPVIMVGDMHHDVLAGKAAGGLGIGVLTGVCSKDELEQAGADFVLDSIKNIGDMLPEIVATATVA